MKLVAVAAALTLASGCASSNRSVAKPVAAQSPQRACLHGTDEAPEQLSRRRQAIGLVRQINTLQAAAFPPNNRYSPLSGLPITQPTPAGFVVHLTTDGTSYAFSVKDTMDPCLFGFFSDQQGVIFEGRVIQ